MKNKIFIVLLLCMFILTGCTKKLKIDDNIGNIRNNVINNIGISDDNKLVIKGKNDLDEDIYYVYKFNISTCVCYLYTFHSSIDSYNKKCDAFMSPKFELSKIEDAYVTRITLSKEGYDSKDKLLNNLINKYSSDKYEIIK